MHVFTHDVWDVCNPEVYGNFTFDFDKTSTEVIEQLMNDDFKIWIYSGD
jgi:hypothetical protein